MRVTRIETQTALVGQSDTEEFKKITNTKSISGFRCNDKNREDGTEHVGSHLRERQPEGTKIEKKDFEDMKE